ncbi:hypothetical protein [Gimesia chilikensis]|uniref:hypothetical protein n=1 Tax=Gimesia chilikensis TaxID=2605989 RepID=UPI00118C3F01|nr:hypothetical protein [Gimesia chilikensis]QDT84616.1 hypothetical protein MalM14_22760 [Gimesia chilikensis]
MPKDPEELTFWAVLLTIALTVVVTIAQKFGGDIYLWIKSFFVSDSSTPRKPLSPLDFTKIYSIEHQETFFGVVCRWDQIIGKYGLEEVKNLEFFCPRCDTELVCYPKEEDYEAPFRRPGKPAPNLNQTTKLFCEECRQTVYEYPGFEPAMIRRFTDQIERLFRKKLKESNANH